MQIERNIVFWGVAFVVAVGLLWLLSPILLPFVLGMAIAYLLDPLNRRLIKRGMSRFAASFIIMAGFVLGFVVLLLFVLPPLISQLSGFIENAPGYAQRLQGLVSNPDYPWLKRIVGVNLLRPRDRTSHLTAQLRQEIHREFFADEEIPEDYEI